MTHRAQDGLEPSLEALADRRSSEVEFREVMDLLRASPHTRRLAEDELEKRARKVWAKFEHVPVRSFVPVLVEREVLRTLTNQPDEG